MQHAMHAARLAMLEAGLLALLREASDGQPPNDMPDSIIATMDADGIDIEYRRGPIAVGGEGI